MAIFIVIIPGLENYPQIYRQKNAAQWSLIDSYMLLRNME